MTRAGRRAVHLLAIVAFALVLGAGNSARAEPGDELTISLLTFGPGDHPFTKFGHNGLLVENRELGTAVVYNYGTFSFDSLWLVPKFLLGKYRYWLSTQSFEATVAAYTADNRSIVAQRLRLSAEQKREMLAFLRWNALGENKYYVFDYYRDNCATRIRDLIDKATKGALARDSTMPAQMTWRQHTERLTADDFLVYFGLYIAMGSLIDRPITVWDEMFLPVKLEEAIRRDSLVSQETTLVAAHRAPPREEPPSWIPRFALAGTLMGGGLALLGRLANRRGPRIALRIGVAAVGLVLGTLGTLFVFLWAFTNHEVAHHNENILACAPFAVLLAGAGAQRAFRIAAAALALALFGTAAKLLPWFTQDNWQLLALVLPLWMGVAAGTWLAAGRGQTSAQ